MKNTLGLRFIITLFCLAFTSGVTANEFPGSIPLDMDPPAAEWKLFESYLSALENSLDQSELISLADGGRAILEAVKNQDYEAYLAAKAVYGYRLETLSEEALAGLRVVEGDVLQLAPASEVASGFQEGDKVTVNYGCGAQLYCDDASVVSCSCSNGQSFNDPPSKCVYKPNYNPWGGQVDCDCSGTAYDSVRTCPYGSLGNCSYGCLDECGLVGGSCIRGNCVCN